MSEKNTRPDLKAFVVTKSDWLSRLQPSILSESNACHDHVIPWIYHSANHRHVPLSQKAESPQRYF